LAVTRVEQAISALKLLAAAPADQIKRLSAFFGTDLGAQPDHNIDEIVLEYEDIAKAAASMLRDNEINSEQAAALTGLDEMIGKLAINNPSRFWTVWGLSNDVRWNYIRHHASECLRIFNA
jgi:succinate dehydrogenase/fumarate reductase flavoprotein subunit